MPRIQKIYDLSPLVSPRAAVFPGCAEFHRKILMDFKRGDHLSVSDLVLSAHAGAHADAPSHTQADGQSIEHCALDLYVGPCQVVSVNVLPGARILPKDMPAGLADGAGLPPRVLFKTASFDHERWPTGPGNEFAALSPELVDTLATRGVKLVGIDTPSIDPMTSKKMESHTAAFRHGIAILEGLDLSSIPDGAYFLSAAPLKLEGADAGPTRALAIEFEDFEQGRAGRG